MSPPWITCSFALAAVAAELIHWRRVRDARHLLAGAGEGAFGLGLAAAALAGLARSLAVAALAWGASTLIALPPESHAAEDRPGEVPMERTSHVVYAIDVSPSMSIADQAGGAQTRAGRAAEVLGRTLTRIDYGRTRVSVVPFFSEAKPAVVDTFDPNVARNALDGLPFMRAFKDGETDVIAAVRGAFDLAAGWPPGSASVVICSDGDSVPPTGMPDRPASVANVLVAGVGDTSRGTFVGGRLSRQEDRALAQLALRLGGRYFNASQADLPAEAAEIVSPPRPAVRSRPPLGRRELALAATAAGAVLLLATPVSLALFDLAGNWRQRRRA